MAGVTTYAATPPIAPFQMADIVTYAKFFFKKRVLVGIANPHRQPRPRAPSWPRDRQRTRLLKDPRRRAHRLQHQHQPTTTPALRDEARAAVEDLRRRSAGHALEHERRVRLVRVRGHQECLAAERPECYVDAVLREGRERDVGRGEEREEMRHGSGERGACGGDVRAGGGVPGEDLGF
jgi:hypothetical protein